MLAVLFAGALAIPLAAAARPAAHSALTLSLSSPRTSFGHAVVLSGRLSGGHVAGRTVVVDATPYGDASAHRVATATTNARGDWRVAVHPRIQTTYRAGAAGAASARVTVGVEPA